MDAARLHSAAGDAFRSGADQALLHRSCAAIGEPAFQTIEARSRGLQLTAFVGFVLLGGAIVDRWGFDAGWIVETICSIGGLAIACAMAEPPARADDIGVDDARPNDAAIVARGRFSDHVTRLMPLILPAAVLGASRRRAHASCRHPAPRVRRE